MFVTFFVASSTVANCLRQVKTLRFSFEFGNLRRSAVIADVPKKRI